MLIVVGGCMKECEQECLSTCEYLLNNNNFIESSLHMNVKRRSPCPFIVDGHLLVVGGCSDGNAPHLSSAEVLFNAVKCISGGDEGWRVVTDNVLESIGGSIDGFSCAAYCTLQDNTLFIAGGYDGREALDSVFALKVSSSPSPDNSLHLTTNQLKNMPTRLKNSTTTPLPSSQSVLLIGGWDGKRTLNTVFEYSMINQACVIRQVLPFRVEGHTTTQLNNDRLIICGGYDGVMLRNAIHLLNLSTDGCIQIGALEIARENHVAAIVKDEEGHKIFIVVGGWNGHQALKECEAFELLSHHPWLQRSQRHNFSLNTPRNRPAAVAIGHNK